MNAYGTAPQPAGPSRFGASTPISPANTTSSVGYSAYGYGAGGSSAAGPSSAPGQGARARLTKTNPSGGYGDQGPGQGQPRRQGSGEIRTGRSSAGGGGSQVGADPRDTPRVHFMALRAFLRSWLQNESPGARSSAREKLTRLSKGQFHELSTDVYDELMRRQQAEDNARSSAPFLSVREDFHPKRNQARQKLATLPPNRFKDLASDVYFELKRRFPAYEEMAIEEEADQADEERSRASGSYYHSQAPPLPPTHQRRPSGDPSYPPSSQALERLNPGPARRPSQINRITPSTSQQANLGISASANSSTNDIVVPNKSTLTEERIEVPYAREMSDEEEEIVMGPGAGETRSQSRLDQAPARDSRDRAGSRAGQRSESRQEPVRSGSSQDVRAAKLSTSSSALELADKRPESDAKILGMERRIQGLEKELEASARREQWERERSRELEDEVRGLKERATGHAGALRSVQREVENAQNALEAEKQRAEGKRKEQEVELNRWRTRSEQLEDEVNRLNESRNARSDQETAEAMRELQNEVVSLVEELKILSQRNEELQLEKEGDEATIQQLDEEAQGYKRRWEKTKTELRNLKATSTMFIAKPLTDDHLPASADGNIADIHVTDFQGAIDTLLTAARSSTPTGVLPAMKAVVEAITNISDDVKAYEAEPNFPVDSTTLEDLKHRSTTTLNGLMQAARNHAMSAGLSPVVLLDAAAGHVSANVVEIIKLLKIRKTIRKTSSRGSIFAAISSASPNGNSAGSSERLRRSSRGSSEASPVPTRSASRSNGVQQSASQMAPLRPTPPVVSPLDTSAARVPGLDRSQSIKSAISLQSDAFDLDPRKNAASVVMLDSASTLNEKRGSGFPFPAVQQNGSRGLAAPQGGRRGTPNGDEAARRERDREMAAQRQRDVARSQPVQSPTMTGDMRRQQDQVNQLRNGLSDSNGIQEQDPDDWEELKPYLKTQSSALVDAIQKLLAEIRVPAQSSNNLNDHISEVIAIGSSIIAITSSSLPASSQEGQALLQDLIRDTDRLGEKQGQQSFDKATRQELAGAAFGVAKTLKLLMKLK